MPLAIEQFDLSAYDLIISSCHAVSKGVLTGPDQTHISYIHTPIRYAWDMQNEYLSATGMTHGLKSSIARAMLHYIRLWDFASANRVDAIAANSQFVARRIKKFYRRESQVIYPPVDVTNFQFCSQKDDYYLTVSRLVEYKKVELIVRAFADMPEKRLIVIGDGPEYRRIKQIAPVNVQILGFQTGEVIRNMMQQAKAFLIAAREDFGITSLEAQACGTPVIAYGVGGSVETIHGLSTDKPTGIFYFEQSVQSIQAAILEFENARSRYDPANCRENALQFTPERFRSDFECFAGHAMDEHI
jgi:glycosyltransferase involved in cell wall biosynthesis